VRGEGQDLLFFGLRLLLPAQLFRLRLSAQDLESAAKALATSGEMLHRPRA